MRQNSYTIDDYNTIIGNLTKKINNYIIAKIKRAFLYKLETINIISLIKIIIKRNIFRTINLLNKEDNNNFSSQKVKSNDSNPIFLIEDKNAQCQ